VTDPFPQTAVGAPPSLTISESDLPLVENGILEPIVRL
jgi:hypothetical protein